MSIARYDVYVCVFVSRLPIDRC